MKMSSEIVQEPRTGEDLRGKGRVLAELSGVEKTYTSANAANGLLLVLSIEKLCVFEGEVLVLMGPSGCGKTTTLRLLSGQAMPSCGTVFFNGLPLDGPRKQIGVMSQADSLWPFRTILENVMFSAEMDVLRSKSPISRIVAELRCVNHLSRNAFLRHHLARSTFEKAKKWLSEVGLEGFESAFPKELSGGMRKRAELARANFADPALLLLDEPFGSLDAFTKEEMQLLLEQLWMGRRNTLVIVTHDWHEAVALADRVVVFTQRPGSVQTVKLIDLPRPRNGAVRKSRQFLDLAENLREQVALQPSQRLT